MRSGAEPHRGSLLETTGRNLWDSTRGKGLKQPGQFENEALNVEPLGCPRGHHCVAVRRRHSARTDNNCRSPRDAKCRGVWNTGRWMPVPARSIFGPDNEGERWKNDSRSGSRCEPELL